MELELYNQSENENRTKSSTSLGVESVVLAGHKGAVYSGKFHPDGNLIATGGHDSLIFIWDVNNKCKNVGLLKAHKNAVLQVDWSRNGDYLFSCSADNFASVFDSKTFRKIRKVKGHKSIINSISPCRKSEFLFSTASNDKTAKLWDIRKRSPITSFPHEYPITATALGSSNTVTASLDGKINVFEKRKFAISQTFVHSPNQLISNLRFSQNEEKLLSNSFDGTICQWDMRPYVGNNKRRIGEMKVPMGGIESILVRSNWSFDDKMACSGSSDGFVYGFGMEEDFGRNGGNILFRLAGHKGTVTEADFSPREKLLLSCGTDSKVYLGEFG